METRAATRSHLRGHKGQVLCLDVTKGGNIFASGSEDSSCRIWDIRTGRSTRRIGKVFDGEDVNSVAFDPKNELKFFAACGNRVLGFDLRNPSIMLNDFSEEFCYNVEEINQIGVHPKKGFLCAGDDSGDVKIVDLDSKRLFKTLSGKHTNICSSVQFRPKTNWDIISGGLDSSAVIWNFSRGRPINHIQLTPYAAEESSSTSSTTQLLNPPFVHSVCFSPDSRCFATGLGDGSAAVFDFASATQLIRLQAHRAAINQVLYPPWGANKTGAASNKRQNSSSPTACPLLLTAGNDSVISLWDVSVVAQQEQQSDQAQDGQGAGGGAAVRDTDDRRLMTIPHGVGINWIAAGPRLSTPLPQASAAEQEATRKDGSGAGGETSSASSGAGGDEAVEAASPTIGPKLIVADTSCNISVYDVMG